MRYGRHLTWMIVILVSPTLSQVVIERVLVDPVGNETRNDTPEKIELLNLGPDAQDLAGWTLSSSPPADSPDLWAFPDGIVLDPGVRAAARVQ